LSKANLTRSQFIGTDLQEANLHEARLNAAIFDGANLKRANFSQAILGSTIFVRTDLSLALELETVKHVGPSSIGIDTIYRSQGNIAEIFLRGAGVPDSFITYAHSLISQPIEYYACFISYSHHDETLAQRLYVDLQSKGVRCWFASEDLKIGDHYHQRIDESIRMYDKLVLVLSEHAIQSPWVEREVVTAREKEDHEQRPVLFPIRLDDAVMDTTKAWAADVRRRWHIGDFRRWKDHDACQQAFERLLRDLKSQQKPRV
jgi:TIR domain/Pentapeptide repeats (8 copies)